MNQCPLWSWLSQGVAYLFMKIRLSYQESCSGVVVKALGFQRCGPGFDPRHRPTCFFSSFSLFLLDISPSGPGFDPRHRPTLPFSWPLLSSLDLFITFLTLPWLCFLLTFALEVEEMIGCVVQRQLLPGVVGDGADGALVGHC